MRRRGCLTWTQEGNAIIRSGEGLLSRVEQQLEDALMYNQVCTNRDGQRGALFGPRPPEVSLLQQTQYD